MLQSLKMLMLILSRRRRRKQLIPISLKQMMLPSASQGANDTPTNGNIDIILQSFVNCIDKEGIYLELCCCKPSGALEIVQRCRVPFLSLVMSFTIVGCLI